MNDQKFARGDQSTQRTRRRGLAYVYLVLPAMGLAALMILIASTQSTFVKLGYDIIELRDQNAELREEQVRLRTELAWQRSPARVLPRIVGMGLRPVPAQQCYEVDLSGIGPGKLPGEKQPRNLEEADGDLVAKMEAPHR